MWLLQVLLKVLYYFLMTSWLRAAGCQMPVNCVMVLLHHALENASLPGIRDMSTLEVSSFYTIALWTFTYLCMHACDSYINESIHSSHTSLRLVTRGYLLVPQTSTSTYEQLHCFWTGKLELITSISCMIHPVIQTNSAIN